MDNTTVVGNMDNFTYFTRFMYGTYYGRLADRCFAHDGCLADRRFAHDGCLADRRFAHDGRLAHFMPNGRLADRRFAHFTANRRCGDADRRFAH